MMVEGEATQEPDAPEGAPASPPAEDAPAQGPDSGETAEIAAEAASDWSHLCGFQAIEPAQAALAGRADYADELAKELGVRSARFAQSVDDSIVLASDGLMRWLGDPVARVVAGDQLMQPRGILLADEALTGEDRAAVETRVALWLGAHVRKVLGPLLALAEGTDIPEAARPLANRIAEALGVLERERVRNEVRSLEQTARGALRKHGVRFGSLYIHVPVLLKPGARGLCTLLWTLRRGTEAGAERLLAFASAGRTSFGNEGLLSPDAYRVAGFRLCGERVVRVDIIERLSDLIRAALPDHMRTGGRSASDAYGFVITPQMTSLTGCSGEAFASILRSLGFEPVMVAKSAFDAARVKAPMEPIRPAEAGEAEVAAEASEEAPVAEIEEAEVDGQAPAEEAPAPEAEEAPAAEEKAVATEAEAASSGDIENAAQPEVAEDSEPAEAAVAEDEAVEAVAAEGAGPADGEAAAVAADELVEIWRPAPRRPRATRPVAENEARPHRGRQHRRHERAATPEPAASADAPATSLAEPERPPRPPRRDDQPRRFDKGADKRAKDEAHEGRPPKTFGPRRESRPAAVDPDSPFAKLAALKPLLERRDKRP